MKTKILSALVGLALFGCGQPVKSSTEIAPTNEAISYQGRYEWASDGPVYALSGSTVALGFTGTSIAVRLNELVSGTDDYGDPRRNLYDIVIDGKQHGVLEPRDGKGVHVLAEGLSDDDHELKLFKRTEPWIGEAQLLGFVLDEGAVVKPVARPSRRIEFIGDSLTVGLGVEGESEDCSYAARYQNHAAAFPTLVTQSLNAEHIAVAASGLGVAVNYEGTNEATMPQVYPRALLTRVNSKWTFDWKPHAVVVALGSSDFQRADPGRERFVREYVSLLKQVRDVYPDAFILVVSGPMLTDEFPVGVPSATLSRQYIDEAVATFKSAGGGNLDVLHLPADDGSRGYGCSHHPSKATHRWMAEQITAALKSKLGW